MSSLHPTVAFRLSSLLQGALADAETRGEKRVRIVARLHPWGSINALKRGLARRGVVHYRRELETFLAVELSRDEILGVSQFSEDVSAIWLDQPVSAAEN
jgi:hypothetical protein